MGSGAMSGSGGTKSGTSGSELGAEVIPLPTVALEFKFKLEPHWPQKLASSCTVAPQLGQVVVAGKGV